MPETMSGPAPSRAPHDHDSRRLDGWLDTCCMRCGASGYWRDGEEIDYYEDWDQKIHPSGDVLIRERKT